MTGVIVRMTNGDPVDSINHRCSEMVPQLPRRLATLGLGTGTDFTVHHAFCRNTTGPEHEA